MERPSAAEPPLIEGMSRFYIYDFSEMQPAISDEMGFDQQGDFGIQTYLEYWTESGRDPLLIRLGKRPFGFAMINTHCHQGGSVARNMGEFFVPRKYRRRGDGGLLLGPLALAFSKLRTYRATARRKVYGALFTGATKAGRLPPPGDTRSSGRARRGSCW